MKKPDKNFFDNFKNRLDDLIDDEQLSIGRVGHPYIVPYGYFEALKTAILRRIDALSAPSPFIEISRPQRRAVWYSAAAAMVLFISSLVYFTQSENNATDGIDQLSNEDIVAYLDTQPMIFEEITSDGTLPNEAIEALLLENIPVEANDTDAINSTTDLLNEINNL